MEKPPSSGDLNDIERSEPSEIEPSADASSTISKIRNAFVERQTVIIKCGQLEDGRLDLHSGSADGTMIENAEQFEEICNAHMSFLIDRLKSLADPASNTEAGQILVSLNHIYDANFDVQTMGKA